MIARCALVVGLMLLPVTADAKDPRCGADPAPFAPRGGVVADEKMATTVAWTYLVAIYGITTTRAELPLRAKMRDGVWTVKGNSRGFAAGGVAEILLCRNNGRVLRVVHGQ